jgi:hypothetical protein
VPTIGASAVTEATKAAPEVAMWTCRNCNACFTFDQVEAQIDGGGYFFICPGCDYRNKLVNTGPDATGRPQFVQRDE